MTSGNAYQSPSLLGWVTNDPAVAKKLRAADAAYDRARQAAAHLALAEKVDALRAARRARNAAYEAAAGAQ